MSDDDLQAARSACLTEWANPDSTVITAWYVAGAIAILEDTAKGSRRDNDLAAHAVENIKRLSANEQPEPDAVRLLAMLDRFEWEYGAKCILRDRADYRRALRRAESGDADGVFQVAESLFNGRGVVKILPLAVEWYEKAAAKGSNAARYRLALCYDQGKGVEKDLQESKALAAKFEAPRSADEYYAASLWLSRDGVDATSKTKAFEFCAKAAESGHSEALGKLALMYFMGEGTMKDPGQAIRYFEQSALKGDTFSAFMLTALVPADRADLRQALIRVATTEEHPGCMVGAARMLLNGRGGLSSTDQGVKMLHRAVSAGSIEAHGLLGGLYAYGLLGIQKDYDKALEVLNRGVLRRDRQSFEILGEMYLEGRGVPADAKRAFELTRAAAEMGSVIAMTNVAAQLWNGRGVTQDRDQAIEWYKKAARAGHKPTQQLLRQEGIRWDE